MIRTARPTSDEHGRAVPAACRAPAESSAGRGDIAAGRRRARRRGRGGAGVAARNRRAVDDRRLIGRRTAPPTIAPAATQRAAAQRQHDRQDQHLLHDSNSHRNRLVPSQGSCPKELYTTIGDEQTQHRCFSATIHCRTCRANRARRMCAICRTYRPARSLPLQHNPGRVDRRCDANAARARKQPSSILRIFPSALMLSYACSAAGGSRVRHDIPPQSSPRPCSFDLACLRLRPWRHR